NDSYSFRYEIANSLWVNQNNRLLKDYQKTVQKAFRAEVEPADFADDVSGTVRKINAWCNEKTHGMIPKIVEEYDISPSLKAILINSLYFESPWVNEWHVTEGEFTPMEGKKKTQDMLYGIGDCYYENDKATAFGKDYANGFRFIGILPKDEGEFSILDLDLESLVKSENYDYDVSARMPKLNYGTTEEAVEKILKAQGMELPFSLNAEIDEIIENNNLYISQIIQKTKIELDENGTKAAAVTAIMMKASGMMPQQEVKEVILDRPFAFMIYDTQNDEILFLGKVTQSAE
ncbi:MAG: serpin family protein, partial [Lachnospiraceae bacterium]|nr:serpin family protein [Lachnospiraceae bacterium]